jgi:hypothetical protein
MLSFIALAGSQLMATVSVRLTAPSSTVPVGTTLNFTAAASDSKASNTRFSYQFTMRPAGVGSFTVIQDFYWDNTFPWTESAQEGWYDIGVTAWSLATHDSGATYTTVYVSSRITGGSPVISSTANALVALYSAPPCKARDTMSVRFAPGSFSNAIMVAPEKACNGLSMNFYIAGLKENTKYVIQHVLNGGGSTTLGPQLTWTSGTIPPSVHLPNFFKVSGPTAASATTNPYLLRAVDGYNSFATDIEENIVWYYPGPQGEGGYMTHLTKDHTFLLIADDLVTSKALCGATFGCGDHQFFREVDLAGNLVRQTNWTILTDKVNAWRAQLGLSAVRPDFIHHEGIRLPNGYTITMITDEQVKDQGTGPVDVLGDVIVVLNQNLDVVWTWDTFDFLPIKRQSVIQPGSCGPGSAGCPAQFHNKDKNGQVYSQVNDWTHTNSVFYDVGDGNLIVSCRNQSWVMKIAYKNGTGDGHILWTLGHDGSFSLPPGYPVSTWQSGQHDPEIQSNGLLSLFDNNNPSPSNQQPGGNSHGQAWSLDFTHMVATPVVNVDLGTFSPAVGSAALLPNGNYTFTAGFIDTKYTQIFEVTPSGTFAFEDQTDALTYRSFRLHDMYTPTHFSY